MGRKATILDVLRDVDPEEHKSVLPPKSKRPERAKDRARGFAGLEAWLQVPTRVSRLAMLITAGVVILLCWGAYEVGAQRAEMRGKTGPRSDPGFAAQPDPMQGKPQPMNAGPNVREAFNGDSRKSPQAPPPSGKRQPIGYRIVTYKKGVREAKLARALRDYLREQLAGAARVDYLESGNELIVAVLFGAAERGDEQARAELLARLRRVPELRSREARFDFAKQLTGTLLYGRIDR